MKLRRFAIDRSFLFLLGIIGLVLGGVIVMVIAARTDPVDFAVNEDRILRIALIFEVKGKPASTELMLYYPKNSRAALLDIPPETGLILKSLNRVDSIDVLYKPDSPKAYLNEIAGLTKTSIDWHIIFDEKRLSAFIDLLDGISLFLPNKIYAETDAGTVMLPSGFVVLDGKKALAYILYNDPYLPDGDQVARRQTIIQAVLKKVVEKSAFIIRPDVYPSIKKLLRTNLSAESLKRLLDEISKLDSDRIVLQRLTGYYRKVEGKQLLFPHYDGELVQDIVKQSLNALINADSGSTSLTDKVITLQILNGTSERGLAQKTAEIFQSFGYEINSIDNAPSSDFEKTIILDRYGDKAAAQTVGNVIRCTNIEDHTMSGAASADFVIILGKDFNGRNCVK